MSVVRLSFVSVREREETTWAELSGGEVTYAPHDFGIAQAVIEQHQAETGDSLAETFAALRRDGWSNAYVMVAREGIQAG